MEHVVTRKKLIEVALPLEAINAASAREKSIRHGHPSTLHLWWARRPLATARAVLFSQLVDDPFAGGGSIPLEAQRLGLEAHASDLNPVAVLINKAMIEIPPRFAGRPPVNPEARRGRGSMEAQWKGAAGLAEDVRYYGKWMRDEAEKRIGHLYPKVEVTAEMAQERPDLKPYVGRKLTVIAWLWARTVKSPNPAFANVDVPLASSFVLSTKSGKEAYVEPVIENDGYRFTVKVGLPPLSAKNGTKMSRGSNFQCSVSGVPIGPNYIRSQGMSGHMGARLMAIVTEGDRERVYLSPIPAHQETAAMANPAWKPEGTMPDDRRWFSPPPYGMAKWADLFTDRQLVALSTFSDLVAEAQDKVTQDALAAGMTYDGTPLRDDGTGAIAYAEMVGVYLAFAICRLANRLATVCVWNRSAEKVEQVFARQAIPMVWDFPEVNPFSGSTGGWSGSLDWIPTALGTLPSTCTGTADQRNALVESIDGQKLISTDPPYYDNIGYSDLSDFFYVWLRRTLRNAFPELLATLAVPKSEELVANSHRHGSRERAEAFFLNGMSQAMRQLAQHTHPGFPMTVYYAFKQSEKKGDIRTASTGWETFLDAVVDAGFTVEATWPVRTERPTGVKAAENSLASSIVLACRPRASDVPIATRREFLDSLRSELPEALRKMQQGNIAPVDLAQAAIGPGMAIFSSYARVLDASGAVMSVREALALINETLDEVLAEQEGDFDADTRWALAWFEQSGFGEGEYGVAETLSTAKNTSVAGMMEAGILISGAGKVRLLAPAELPQDWHPKGDSRRTVWETTHHLVRVHAQEGETAAAGIMANMGADAEPARDLAYRLFRICELRNRPQEALGYNALVRSWGEISGLATQARQVETQGSMLR